ncbi:SUN domain-containing ossification factor isoform X2 [Drosophila guanche]|uniref:Blast:SUN domain-containing ossification factor n=1 Tax=Drosophila guanche TaxID=7266 RepID=A0A3B0K0Z6_DROGU|nr:SUN domain-containing ossification factor isoform X2 [Drosophila guanche]SPP79629.1 blast:SUN domain-containing ossification factor [Drosophila guanche]
MLLQFAVKFICCELKKLKTNLTMFLIFFWIIWFSQIIAISTVFMSFPEIITELPTVTVTELPLDRLKNRLESVILEEIQSPTSNKSEEQQQQQQQQQQEEQTLQPLFEAVKEVPQKDEQMPKINDPGGGYVLDGLASSAEALGAAGDDGTGNVTSEEQQAGGVAGVAEGTTNDTMAPKANLTKANEEVPMPVFSEWAQKQMEAEASREQAMELEQQVANNSAQRRNNTGSASGKPSTLKLRSKNYASPDCGAKIIASNGDATNTGAVLTQSSDEYMLSTCGSRIWFVVELCEAIQAQKVELANFELFSSSPKNFTVAVSKRFPTRDWSNVGRFAAEDKRTVQTFELHPHLFGKFVRVDIHSHYSKEHFCPVSLFRVFGTSEFEAFETEIRPSDEMDDFDDDFEQGSSHKGNAGGGGGGGGIFQSASDAVISMVKKAAEVLVKPTKALKWSVESLLCRTPTFGSFSCSSCNSTLVQRINSLLSCQFQQLQGLLNHSQLRSDMLQSGVCQEEYGIGLWSSNQSSGLAKRQSYFLSMLPAEHVGAMCKLLQAEQNNTVEQQLEATPELKPPPEPAQENATAATETSSQQELIVEEAMENQASLENVTPEAVDSQELPSIGEQSQPSTTTTAATTNSTPADVNIFNVPAELEELELPVAPTQPTVSAAPVTPSLVESPSDVEATTMAPSSSELPHNNADLPIEDSNPANWESLDNLLTTTVASITAGGSAAAAAAAAVAGNGNGNHLGVGVGVGTAGAGAGGIGSNVNLQQKLTNGAQSESVFIRLSNRIKALERNMSLSGQYLEELSRRYKKQVEELQQTLTQQTLTVRSLEDQSRRYIEQEQLYQQQSAELAGEVRALSYQVQACILVIIIVGSFIFLMLVLGTVYYRKLRRQTQQLKADQPSSQARAAKPKLDRRKSYEQMLNQPSPKQRRPSEEAMLILKDCGDSQLVGGCQELSSRQRKISVCYGSNNNIAANMMSGIPNVRASLHRRKGAKHSWHNNSLDTAEMQASAGEQLDTFFDADTLKSLKQPSSSLSGGSKASKKKSLQQQLALKRQESAPASMMQNELALEEEPTSQSDFDESLMLDDDDLANFIPTSDLAYNEFMPEGPSGYLALDAVDGKSNGAEQPQLQKQATKKSRRLSSPAFFKSPFSKSKNKGGSFNGFGGIKNSHSVHESTSWEWYRLKRSEKQQQQQQQQPHHHSKQTKSLPNSSLDSSSLSEVNFPLNSNSNSTQNSFRILGEAIRSSGECSSITPNGNGQAGGSSSGSGSGSNSGGSTTSSTTKKKQRAFNNLFRKVF